ncbi:MAG: hypothetical protein CL810_13550 [Cobetia sp.]|uniref:EpsG family protein n=2 Tax=Cobetia TaxID=204286 RepID=A0ABT6UQ64_9GAMM|nr:MULTISPECIES: hypothetical protein [Cobetia]MBF08105.1 hypothetical protein [Cobetia sp.]MBK10566.1 hypothetical protein [Cobetia sp.]MCK8066817.1 hypothetical protein [Cobetia sp. 1CM21F]MDI5884490.1 hypothetical protein [Cobetia amphilecti]HAR08647.1 hypothetical protein [Cobetia sp.]|tara:strand:- start:16635 stop:17753 length:1119 start_codon:yes stop_codon:yes gene_type:complete
MEHILLDLPNLLVCLVLVMVGFLRGWVTRNVAIILSLSSAVPYLLNNVLFDAEYMPDQFRYWEQVLAMRSMDWGAMDHSLTVSVSSGFLALLPLPLAETITSLGFFNKFLYIGALMVLIRRGIISHAVLLFVLCYPSLVLYSSLSLRDTLVTGFMLGSFLLAIERRPIWALIFLLPLWIIKFQNALIMLIFLGIYLLYDVSRQGLSTKRFCWLLVGLAASVLVIYPLAVDQINFFRAAMYLEDGGKIEDVEVIQGFGDFVVTGIQGALYFLIKPLPWEAANALQLIQSGENLLVVAFLVWLTLKCWQVQREKTLFWLLYLIGAFTIYGLVVFNYGTAVRYRFPFLVIYVVCMAHDTGLVRLWQQQRRPALLD